MSFKQNFIRICNEKGVSPSKVVEAIGLKRSAYSQWTDESVPRKATLMRIADYFDVTVDYLLGKEDAPITDASLSENEKILVELFRKIPQPRQAIVLRMIEAALTPQ